MSLVLEIIEGPSAGQQFDIAQPTVIGRDNTADLVIDDSQASRRHARIEPTAHGAIVEDLGSTNGTFINDNELHGRAELSPHDELLVGDHRDAGPHAAGGPAAAEHRPPRPRPSRPPSRARPSPTRSPASSRPPPGSGVPELERLRDSRVKTKASLAPLAIFVLAALAVVIYLGAT